MNAASHLGSSRSPSSNVVAVSVVVPQTDVNVGGLAVATVVVRRHARKNKIRMHFLFHPSDDLLSRGASRWFIPFSPPSVFTATM